MWGLDRHDPATCAWQSSFLRAIVSRLWSRLHETIQANRQQSREHGVGYRQAREVYPVPNPSFVRCVRPLTPAPPTVYGRWCAVLFLTSIPLLATLGQAPPSGHRDWKPIPGSRRVSRRKIPACRFLKQTAGLPVSSALASLHFEQTSFAEVVSVEGARRAVFEHASPPFFVVYCSRVGKRPLRRLDEATKKTCTDPGGWWQVCSTTSAWSKSTVPLLERQQAADPTHQFPSISPTSCFARRRAILLVTRGGPQRVYNLAAARMG